MKQELKSKREKSSDKVYILTDSNLRLTDGKEEH